MEYILVGLFVLSGIFFLWFGIVVETGVHQPKPYDPFLPIPFRGFNVDYFLGVAGIGVGIALLLLAFSIILHFYLLATLAVFIFLIAIIRGLLPPKHFGPTWYKKTKSKK